MTIELLFWILMLLALIFGVFPIWRKTPVAAWCSGMSPFTWLVVALLGYAVFGWPIHG